MYRNCDVINVCYLKWFTLGDSLFVFFFPQLYIINVDL